MRIGVQALALSMGLNIVFVLLLLRMPWGIPAHAGIAASSACAGLFNAAYLFAGLEKAGIYRAGDGWSRLWIQVLAGNAAMTLALLAALRRLGDWFAMSGLERVAALLLLVAGGAAVYFAVAWACGMRPRALRARVA